MTASHALLIEVRWLGGRFHGVRESRPGDREATAAEWPPSPFRLFQALVAGAYGGRWAAEPVDGKDRAFAWLERQAAPTILAPRGERLRTLTYFVPNNDLDTVGGDPARVGEIRAPKTVRTSAFDPTSPVSYLWAFDGDAEYAQAVAALAERLHTLGHGVDAAYARAEVLSAEAAQARIDGFAGLKLRPTPGPPHARESAKPCPAPGSLESLRRRHAAFGARFETVGRGKQRRALFRQPPKAHARAVAYARPPEHRLFELRPAEGDAAFAPWPLEDAYGLAVAVRDRLAERLGVGETMTERFVVGRSAGPADGGRRVRILPLPSIGSRHTDPRIRRVLVELPPECPVALAEVDWALAGQNLIRSHEGTGVVLTDALLVPANDESMAHHYGVGRLARTWRSVTPMALPEGAARRRIDPDRLAADERAEAKSGEERAREEAWAASAVLQALRHAGVVAPVEAVRVQREPFYPKGLRAEAFAAAERFRKDRLWHAEVRFEQAVAGPLILGDGRFCGLGLMSPKVERPAEVERPADLFAYSMTSDRPISAADRPGLLQAVRRSLMARARDAHCLPLFSGHEADGAPARSGQHRHAYLALTGGHALTLWVVAPWCVDCTWKPTPSDRRAFRDVAETLSIVRAGGLGMIALRARRDGLELLLGPSRTWISATPYRPNSHAKPRQDTTSAVVTDITTACARLGRPRPSVELSGARMDGEISAHLQFTRAVVGPLMLGRDAHAGGGLFLPE